MGLFCSGSALGLQQFCVKPFVTSVMSILYAADTSLKERRELCLELSLSSFCAVYIVLLKQCYVAMPSGYKLVITHIFLW